LQYVYAMKTLLIRGDAPVPPEVREIVRAGSTEMKEIRADEERDVTTLEADRVVLWDGSRLEVLDGDPSAGERAMLRWPEDEDKLRMFFQTGG
jgi:hypothetical protein